MDNSVCARIRAIARDSATKIYMMKTTLPRQGVIAGMDTLVMYDQQETEAHWGYEPFYGSDNIHFSMDIAYLDLGIDEMLRRLDAAAQSAATEEKRCYAAGVAKTYRAMADLIERHAQAAEQVGLERTAANCWKVAHQAPESFEEAVQLFWFVWTIRSDFSHIHFRNPGYYMGTLGRWDQHFYPFLERDLQAGRTTREQALELVKEVFTKMNTLGVGDTLKNMMLGGQDEHGRDESNLLSWLCIEAIMDLKVAEPHLNVRVFPGMDQAFYAKTLELVRMGQGQGEIFNDEVIIPQLLGHGIPPEVAYDYCCDGCEEIIIDRLGAILFKELESQKVLELAYFNGQENPCQANHDVRRWSMDIDSREISTALKLGFESGDMRKAASFEEVYEMYLRQYRYQVERVVDFMHENIRFFTQECVSSMVLAGGYQQAIEQGDDPYKDIIKYMFFQIQSGTISTVADALEGIRKVVFQDKFVTMDQLLDAIARDFKGEGNEVLRQRLLSAPKYGNDIDEVDLLAADISSRFCSWVCEENDKIPQYLWPAMYSIFFLDHSALTSATSDGRHAGDPVAVHNSPTPGKATEGPSAVLQSVAKTDLNQGFAGSPVFLTISRNLIPEDGEGLRIVDSIIRSSIAMKLPILSLAINDVAAMKDAQIHPEQHEDLIVRVWGFNARFIDLTPEMQAHIIGRTVGAPC